MMIAMAVQLIHIQRGVSSGCMILDRIGRTNLSASCGGFRIRSVSTRDV
jgi:hypothetical protein